MGNNVLGAEWLSLDRVSEITGISRRLLDSRIDTAGIMAYRDPRDYRRRLIHERDIPKLTTPQPITCSNGDLAEGDAL